MLRNRRALALRVLLAPLLLMHRFPSGCTTTTTSSCCCGKTVTAVAAFPPHLPVQPTIHKHFLFQSHKYLDALWASSGNNEDTTGSSTQQSSNQTGAKVRFSGTVSRGNQNRENYNIIDTALSFLISDIGSIFIGLVGLILLLGARLFVPPTSSSDAYAIDNLAQETRTTLLAVLATGSVLLNGISKLDVDSVVSEPVTLVGVQFPRATILVADDDLGQSTTSKSSSIDDITWSLDALLAATPAMTAVLLRLSSADPSGYWIIEAAAGTLPSANIEQLINANSKSPILDRFRNSQQKETYLPTLQALPGRYEFTYLPPNTQATLLLPVDGQRVIVLGSNQAKSFTPRNIAWSQAVATRLAVSS